MKTKIKKYILKWLGLDREIMNLRNRCEFLESLVDVSVDVHQRSPSWAVVCLRGKIERVNFYEGSSESIKEILKFLSNFKKENIIIDAHPQCKYYMAGYLNKYNRI